MPPQSKQTAPVRGLAQSAPAQDIDLPMPPGGRRDPVLPQPGMAPNQMAVREADPEYRQRAGLPLENAPTTGFSFGDLMRYNEEKTGAGYPENIKVMPRSSVPTYTDPILAALAGIDTGLKGKYLKGGM